VALLALWDRLRAKLRWQQIGYLATIAASVLFLWVGNRVAFQDMKVLDMVDASSEVVCAKVDRIWARDIRPYRIDSQVMEAVTIYFEATITSGPRSGSQVGAEQINDPLMAVQLREVEAGDRITMIRYQRSEEEQVWVLQEYDRSRPLMALGAVFLLLLLLFGGKKGFHTIVSLVFTCLGIFIVFIPLILAGYNIYIATLIICIFITGMTLSLVNGLNRKSLSAAVGCLGGLLVSGILVWVLTGALKLTGFVEEESAFLLYMNPDNPLDLKAIIFSGILIGALGATLDVAVSMASALCEISATSLETSFRSMVRSGVNIGRDIMGTMTNTLILAYIGGSLTMSLLLIVYSNSLLELINREMIVVEILQAVIGSIGLLCAIPLTCLFAAYIFTRQKPQE